MKDPRVKSERSARRRTSGLQPRWPDRVATMAFRRRGGRRFRMFRRLIAVGLLLCAGTVAVVQQRASGTGIAVVVLAEDEPVGRTLRPADVSVVRLATVPDGALRSVAEINERVLAGPARRGEVLTDARLVPRSGPDPGPGRVAVPIRPADPGTADLLSPGVHVAVIAVGENGNGVTLAADAVVLSLPPPSDRSSGSKRLVVLGVPTAAADRLTAAALSDDLALRFT